jgi:hypothetical protein
MKTKYLCSLVVAPFCVLLTSRALADSPVTFEILATFDYPGSPYTWARSVNDAGVVAGSFTIDSVGYAGFVRFHDGHFSGPIADPNDRYHGSELTGINNFQTACGDYRNNNARFFGFVLSGGNTFTPFHVVGTTSTYMGGINDAGNLCGGSDRSSGWVSIGGVVSAFDVPGARKTSVIGINNLNQCVGDYLVVEGGEESYHGFRRDADGTLVYPIDARNAASTVLFGINDRGQMVGNMTDRTGKHAVFFIGTHLSATFDYPGATSTNFDGINSKGVIVGEYFDTDGFQHSFLVRVKLLGMQ